MNKTLNYKEYIYIYTYTARYLASIIHFPVFKDKQNTKLLYTTFCDQTPYENDCHL